MRILQVLQHFNYLSGAPLYVYELSRELAKEGHEVVIASNCGGDLQTHANLNGIMTVEKDVLLGLEPDRFDVMHLHQPKTTELALKAVPGIPAVVTVHSEWPEYEGPFKSDLVKKYIAIRPSIAKLLVERDGIDPEKVVTIYNPVDRSRFNTEGTTDERTILFVGTIDHLRRKAAEHLIADIAEWNRLYPDKKKRILFVGRKFDTWADNLPGFCSWMPPMWNIEEQVKKCSVTAGILMGRTTIEGWMCGKFGAMYEVDLKGNITGFIKQEALPTEEELKKFDSRLVADQVMKIYEQVA